LEGLNCDLTSIFPTVPEGAWGSETKGETKGGKHQK